MRRPRPSAADDAETKARSALKAGRFEEALPLYEALHAAAPEDSSHALALSALLSRLRGPSQAQEVMRAHFAAFPLGRAPNGGVAARPLVLMLRGFDGTRPTLGLRGSGAWKPKLRGGHFTTRYLLDRTRIAQQRVTITQAGLDPAALPAHDLLLNTIAEPDVEGASLRALQDYLDTAPPVPVINAPDKVWRTARDRNWQRLRDLPGVTFPRTVKLRFDNASAPRVGAMLEEAGMGRPIILRRTGTQTGRSTGLITNRVELEGYVRDGLTGDFFAIDYRELLWQGRYFRKLRLFCIDGTFYPVVCHLDLIWNVHGGNRKTLMKTDESLMAEERRFLSDWRSYVGTPAADALDRVAQDTALDFFGIDFTVDEDGVPFIFELNAAMRHSFDHARNFPYKMPFDLATSEAFATMVERRAGIVHRLGA